LAGGSLTGKDASMIKLKEPDITIYVFPVCQVTKFTKKKEAEIYRQNMTAETGEQHNMLALMI
jgi:hypothetical protein